jgi:hypothetical protein
MSATNRAIPIDTAPAELLTEGKTRALPQGATAAIAPAPVLVMKPLLCPELPRRFVRVPTHAVGVHPEHREYPRATLRLPLRLRSVDNVLENFPVTLVTRNISSTGVYFLCPKKIIAGARVELEIVLISRPLGRGNVALAAMAHIQRIEAAAVPGWYGVAASFDDVQFDRDDGEPSRFQNR